MCLAFPRLNIRGNPPAWSHPLFSVSLLSELFYVRNHLPVPNVSESEYELEISGVGVSEQTLTLADIKKFPRHTVTAAIQCGGNRRSEMVKVRF